MDYRIEYPENGIFGCSRDLVPNHPVGTEAPTYRHSSRVWRFFGPVKPIETVTFGELDADVEMHAERRHSKYRASRNQRIGQISEQTPIDVIDRSWPTLAHYQFESSSKSGDGGATLILDDTNEDGCRRGCQNVGHSVPNPMS
jgi:hypothetical protein